MVVNAEEIMQRALRDEPMFRRALPVLKRLTDAGFEAYFVGGSVRDVLLGRPIHDVDIATSAFPAEVQALFPKHYDVGVEHGTVMASVDGETYEITTFRTESGYQDFRRPDHVTFVRQLKEDLLRRDFTINALAVDAEGHIYDYFDGLDDLARKQLRAVGTATERFHEDALRMMRGVRFVGQLGFTLTAETAAAIQQQAPLLTKIAIERIRVEMEKLWTGVHWYDGLVAMRELTLVAYCPFPGDALDVTDDFLREMDAAVAFPSADWAWSVWLLLTQTDTTDVALHEATRQLATDWKLSNDQSQHIETLLKAFVFRQQQPFDQLALFRFGGALAIAVERFIAAQQAAKSVFGDRFSTAHPDASRALWNATPIHNKKELVINGRDIIQALDPTDKRWIGRYLEVATKAVVTGQVKNERAVLLEYLTTIPMD